MKIVLFALVDIRSVTSTPTHPHIRHLLLRWDSNQKWSVEGTANFGALRDNGISKTSRVLLVLSSITSDSASQVPSQNHSQSTTEMWSNWVLILEVAKR